jgi:hypothetical protein
MRIYIYRSSSKYEDTCMSTHTEVVLEVSGHKCSGSSEYEDTYIEAVTYIEAIRIMSIHIGT